VKDFKGKTAFVTGGASGIGLGTSKVFVKNGMKVVLVDARQHALDEAVAWFKEHGGDVYSIKMNVTDREAFTKAADEAESVFGNIHVLFNNAGVGTAGIPVAKSTYKDWDYVLGVNLGGVINGVVTFLPRMLKHGEEGHIVSTSSTCGLLATANMGMYCTSKYAVTGFMEVLADELQDANIGVSILYPGPTRTNLGQSSNENRPAHLKNEVEIPRQPMGERPRSMEDMQKVFMDPLEMGERVMRGIKRNDLFIHTHPEFTDGYIARHAALIRAVPDEKVAKERWDIIKPMRTTYTTRYDKQEKVGPPDW